MHFSMVVSQDFFFLQIFFSSFFSTVFCSLKVGREYYRSNHFAHVVPQLNSKILHTFSRPIVIAEKINII